MRVIALLSTYNERRFITGCIEHLLAQGVEVLLLDDGSTDGTAELAEPFLGHGLVDIRRLARGTHYDWAKLLHLKEQLAHEMDADWFIHVDADERRFGREPGQTLTESIALADADGFNALDFMEYTFLPTREQPDHEHLAFETTMRWYHPFLPFTPHRLTAWKKQPGPVELAWSGGHIVRFPALRSHPVMLPMRHYLFLSYEHALEKYVRRAYSPTEVNHGWHGWRARVRPEDIVFPSMGELREIPRHGSLDPSEPRHTYFVEDRVLERARYTARI